MLLILCLRRCRALRRALLFSSPRPLLSASWEAGGSFCGRKDHPGRCHVGRVPPPFLLAAPPTSQGCFVLQWEVQAARGQGRGGPSWGWPPPFQLHLLPPEGSLLPAGSPRPGHLLGSHSGASMGGAPWVNRGQHGASSEAVRLCLQPRRGRHPTWASCSWKSPLSVRTFVPLDPSAETALGAS